MDSVTISKNYYKDSLDPIVLIALKIGIEEFFYNLLFPDDTNRVIYSTTDYALKKRSSNSDWQNVLLPFMNYREIEITPDNDRNWMNFSTLQRGIYMPEIGSKIKFTPITINFDSMVWFATDRDLNIAYQKLVADSQGETAINYEIAIDGTPVSNYGLLDYNSLQFKPSFNEDEWLKKNKISTADISFTVQTMLPMINTSHKYALTEKVIFNFGEFLTDGSKDIKETREAILNHFDESISDFNLE